LEKYEQSLETSGEEELAKAYFRVKTLCASIREKYDQPWVLSKILELNVEGEEWDDSEDADLDEAPPPNKQASDEEFNNEEPPCLEHALDEEDLHLQGKSPRKKLMKRVINPSKRSKNYLMIMLRQPILDQRVRRGPHEDEVLVFSPPFDEFIQDSIPPAHEEENAVSYFPFQILMMLYSMIRKVKKC
jgi:hypothetical protein